MIEFIKRLNPFRSVGRIYTNDFDLHFAGAWLSFFGGKPPEKRHIGLYDYATLGVFVFLKAFFNKVKQPKDGPVSNFIRRSTVLLLVCGLLMAIPLLPLYLFYLIGQYPLRYAFSIAATILSFPIIVLAHHTIIAWIRSFKEYQLTAKSRTSTITVEATIYDCDATGQRRPDSSRVMTITLNEALQRLRKTQSLHSIETVSVERIGDDAAVAQTQVRIVGKLCEFSFLVPRDAKVLKRMAAVMPAASQLRI